MTFPINIGWKEIVDVVAKYLFIKGILHFYVLKDKHDDPFVRTILRQGEISSILSLFLQSGRAINFNRDVVSRIRLNMNIFGDRCLRIHLGD